MQLIPWSSIFHLYVNLYNSCILLILIFFSCIANNFFPELLFVYVFCIWQCFLNSLWQRSRILKFTISSRSMLHITQNHALRCCGCVQLPYEYKCFCSASVLTMTWEGAHCRLTLFLWPHDE